MKALFIAAALSVASPVAAAPVNMHNIFFSIGQTLQDNVIYGRGPTHLDEYPMDPDIYDFWVHHRAQAHAWAMEGVRAEAGRAKSALAEGCAFDEVKINDVCTATDRRQMHATIPDGE